MSLSLFPIRVPIGTVDQAGNVMMTPEFSRAMADVFQRIGGSDGMSTENIAALANDIAIMSSFMSLPPPAVDMVEFSDSSAEVASLRADVEQLRMELAMVKTAPDLSAQLEALNVMFAMAEDSGALARYITTKAATLNSPAFTGTPTAPTAAVGTNTTQLATTAYALAMLAAPPAIGSVTPAAGTFTSMTATAGFGCNGKAAQTAAVSGGTLAGVISALVANGILSS